VEAWILRTDGGARGNPGPAGCGFVLERPDGTVACAAGRWLGNATNNVAEYQGLLHGLRAAAAFPEARHIAVHADSELMVKQMTGVYRVKTPHLKPLFLEACELARRFSKVTYTHVRREANKHADSLANAAMDARADVGDAPCEDPGQGTLFA
jgi:ribonuclease HI